MSEELPPLPDDVLDLLSAERGAPQVGLGVASRIFDRLELSIGAAIPLPDPSAAPPAAPPPPPSASPPPPVAPPVPSGALGALAKSLGVKGAIVAAFAGGAAVGGTTVSLLQAPAPERVVIVREPAPPPAVVETASAAAQPAAPPDGAGQTEARRPAAGRRTRAHAARARPRGAGSGDRQAIAALESHDRGYRETGLAKEALWIIALHRAAATKRARPLNCSGGAFQRACFAAGAGRARAVMELGQRGQSEGDALARLVLLLRPRL
jgi:hypothetical protein